MVASLLVAVPGLAAEQIEVRFELTGAEQTFTVPAGVTGLHIVAVGASGYRGISPAGRGATVAGDISVTPGSTLFVEVGAYGFESRGGWNGGGNGGAGPFAANGTGGGGGASDIRTISNVEDGSLGSRLLIAAGGGGGGVGPQTDDSLGGDAGEQGEATYAGGGGHPGTSTGGGAGGTGDSSGGGGSLGQGGDGGTLGGLENHGGGGGGGGLYGGGGGGCASTECGGGGGGSSYIGNATNASVGINTGGIAGSVTISYQLTAADVAVALTAPATANRSLSYAIALTNYGPDASTNVVMTDTLPVGTTFQSATAPAGWSCTFPAKGRGGTVRCTVASLPANTSEPASLVIRLSAAARKAGSVSNTVTVASDTADPDPSNNSATATTTVSR